MYTQVPYKEKHLREECGRQFPKWAFNNETESGTLWSEGNSGRSLAKPQFCMVSPLNQCFLLSFHVNGLEGGSFPWERKAEKLACSLSPRIPSVFLPAYQILGELGLQLTCKMYSFPLWAGGGIVVVPTGRHALGLALHCNYLPSHPGPADPQTFN